MSRDQLSVKLFHGRNDPDEDMDDWGFDGPCLGPIEGVRLTYGNVALLVDDRIELPMVDYVILYDGKYYGDAAIQTVEAEPPTTQIDLALTAVPASDAKRDRSAIVVPERLWGEYLRRVEVFVDSVRECVGDRAADAARRALAQVVVDRLRR